MTHYSTIAIEVSSGTVLIYMAYQMGIHRGESQDLSVTDVSQSNRRKNAHLGERSSVDSCQRCSGHGTLVTSGVWTLFYELDDKGSVLATDSFHIKRARYYKMEIGIIGSMQENFLSLFFSFEKMRVDNVTRDVVVSC